MENIYVEVLTTQGSSIVQLGKLGGSKVALRSYTGKEAKHDATAFAFLISEILECPVMDTIESEA